MSTRSTSTSFSGSLSSPTLGLVPPSRYPSVSGSPTLPTPTPSPSTSSGGGSTPFRSFRNFLSLSIGGSKHAAQASSPSAIPKSHFGTLGPIRRSVQVERRASSPQLNPRRSEDDYVLAIDLPRPGDDRSHSSRLLKSAGPSPMARTPLSQTTQSSPAYSPSSETPGTPTDPSKSLQALSPAIESPLPTPALAATELSTILESDTSGISKHLPSLDASQTSYGGESAFHLSPNSFQPQALHPPPRDTRRGSTSPSNDTSELDISTSQLKSEVLAALSESPGKQDWLSGSVVVDDAPSDSGMSQGRTPESPDTSFNLDALDPDLAALLSPNRMPRSSTEPALLAAIDAIPPPQSSRPPTPPPKTPPSARTPPGPSLDAQPSASTRRIPASLSVAPRLPTNTSLPRITRSVSDRPVFGTGVLSGPPSPITRTPSGRAMSSSPERVSAAAAARARLARPTSGDASASTSLRRPGSAGGGEARRTAASRLMTPSRTPPSSISSRPLTSRLNSGAWDADSTSPSSRAPSSVGTAPSRLQEHRPSLDIERPRFTGPTGVRTRKRSTSVIENRVTMTSPTPPAHTPRSMADWLGPRTAKAFAAAGLLDFDKDAPSASASASRPSSRFGTTRSSLDRDSRSRYTPSRTAFSEAGSSSSWGARSGSVSRAAGYSEGMSTAGPLSEAVSTPRTVFSSASTAATSISASSVVHSEIQLLQEKHALETSALLSALADSQRTTKMLREENGQLRERIQALEDKLADTQERIHNILYSQPAQIPTARNMYSSRYASPSSSERRSLTHSRTNSLRPRGEQAPYADPRHSPEASPEIPYDSMIPLPSRRRASASSSLFASLPSNMSMLMHDDDGAPDSFGGTSHHSSSPAGSPTMVFGRLTGIPKPVGSPSSRGGFSHAANKSVSSAGNVSPTTASFSMTTSSPGSLNLRPEHERHLGDMPPLDLDADDFDFEGGVLR